MDDLEDITQISTHGKQDLVYMQSLSAAVVQRSPRYLVLVILLLFLFVAAALLWMSWASIDVVIRGSGKVVPASQVQVIQSLEGGVVSEILLHEGQQVQAGQALIKISDIAFAGSFEENRIKYLELAARSSRLTAEAYDRDFVANPEVEQEKPALNASEKNLFKSKRQQLADSLSILEEQITQQQNALLEAHARKRQLSKSLKLMKKEIKIKKPLKKRGIISEVDFIQ